MIPWPAKGNVKGLWLCVFDFSFSFNNCETFKLVEDFNQRPWRLKTLEVPALGANAAAASTVKAPVPSELRFQSRDCCDSACFFSEAGVSQLKRLSLF